MEDKPQQQCVIPLHKPSHRELAFFFASGILASIPFALVFEQAASLFPSALQFIFLTVVLAPFIEELAKVFPLFYRHGETEKSIVTLGILIGLGFGIFEFFEYVFLLNVPWFVRLPGLFFHASWAAITAYGIAKKNPLPYYLISVTLHATFNFSDLEPTPLGLFLPLIVLITTYYLALRVYHQASKEKMVV